MVSPDFGLTSEISVPAPRIQGPYHEDDPLSPWLDAPSHTDAPSSASTKAAKSPASLALP